MNSIRNGWWGVVPMMEVTVEVEWARNELC